MRPGSLAVALLVGTAATPVRAEPAPERPLEPITPQGHVGELFGASVAVDGPHIAVGAPGTDDAAFHDGVVHIYNYKRGQWGLVALVTPAEPRPQASFGTCLALHGDVLIVGAPFDPDVSTIGERRGRGYIFSGSGDDWHEVMHLELGDDADDLGCPLALTDTRAAFVATQRRQGTQRLARTIVVLARAGGWHEEARIEVPYACFRSSLAMDDDSVVVFDCDNDEMHEFRRDGATWRDAGTITDASSGYAAIDEGTLVVGVSAGVELFRRDGPTWGSVGGFTLPDDMNLHRFAARGSRAVLGVETYRDGAASHDAIVLDRVDDEWQQTALLAANGSFSGPDFAIAMDDARIVLGSPDAGVTIDERAGRVRVFHGPPWTKEATLVAGHIDGCGCRGPDGSSTPLLGLLLALRRRRRSY